jgi:uncharacterized protein YjbJ (UPF0337 family)
MHKFRGGNCIVMVSSVNATALPRDPARRCPWPSVELCSARRTLLCDPDWTTAQSHVQSLSRDLECLRPREWHQGCSFVNVLIKYERRMDGDKLKGNWHQLKGEIIRKWGKITDDDLTEAEGNMEKLVGKIQERTGEKREAIEKWLDSQSA